MSRRRFIGRGNRRNTIKHAWSLRQMKGYVGNCIRVKRSSDSVEMDIGFVSGFLDTATLLTFIGANDGIVVKWYDQGYSQDDFITDNDNSKIVNSGVLVEKNSLAAININLMYSETAYLPEKYTALYCARCYSGTNGSFSNTLRGYSGSGYWRWGYHFSFGNTGRRFSNNGGGFTNLFTLDIVNQSIYGDCHEKDGTWHGVYNNSDIGTNLLISRWNESAGIQIYGAPYQEIIIHDYNADNVSGTYLSELLTEVNDFWGAY